MKSIIVIALVTAMLGYGALAAPTTHETEYKRRRDVAFNFGKDKVRGLSVGGWLILEPWITPSIFQKHQDQGSKVPTVIDEYTLAAYLTKTATTSGGALSILKPHWDTWVTLTDFQKIAKSGFNTVRIPVGYWAYRLLPGDPYVQGAADYVDKAIGWARQLGLKVWIDLHGAPGSQNGFDNSGQLLKKPGWGEGDTVNVTLDVLNTISAKYADPTYQDVVVAIEILNEPNGPELNTEQLAQFYRDGFAEVRKYSNTPVVIHDAFLSPKFWNGVLDRGDNDAENVIVDHHEYQIFQLDNIRWSADMHVQSVCRLAGTYASSDKWVVVGEWTAAMTDCAAALNGYGIGARYDGTFPGSTRVDSCATINFFDQWSQQLKDDTRRYIEAQLDVFEQQTQGWIFWNFRTEASPEWDAFRLIDQGLFPQPLSDRKYPSACKS